MLILIILICVCDVYVLVIACDFHTSYGVTWVLRSTGIRRSNRPIRGT